MHDNTFTEGDTVHFKPDKIPFIVKAFGFQPGTGTITEICKNIIGKPNGYVMARFKVEDETHNIHCAADNLEPASKK